MKSANIRLPNGEKRDRIIGFSEPVVRLLKAVVVFLTVQCLAFHSGTARAETIKIANLYIGMELEECAKLFNETFRDAVGKELSIQRREDGRYMLNAKGTSAPKELQDSIRDLDPHLPAVLADSAQHVIYIRISSVLSERMFHVQSLNAADFLTQLAAAYAIPKMSQFQETNGNWGWGYSGPEGLRIRVYPDKSIEMEGKDFAIAALLLGMKTQAGINKRLGDYAQAETQYRQVLGYCEQNFGPTALETAQALQDLAQIYIIIGDLPKAEQMLRRTLPIFKSFRDIDPLYEALSHTFLGNIYRQLHDPLQAESHLNSAFEIYNKLGPSVPKATAYTFRGNLYMAIGHGIATHGGDQTDVTNYYKRAENYYLIALDIYQQLKIEDEDQAQTQTNIAILYARMGEWTAARLYYESALRVNQSVLGPDHPETLHILAELVYLYYDVGRIKDADDAIRSIADGELKRLANVLSFTSESQRLAFQDTIRPFGLLTLGDHARELAEAVLRYKGIVLDSIIEDRSVAEAARDPKLHQVATALKDSKEKLLQLGFGEPKEASDAARLQREAKRVELGNEIDHLEGDLARQFSGVGETRRALRTSVENVEAQLSANSALIEFIRYNRYFGKGRFGISYGAIIIVHSSRPIWVFLGRADKIDAHIATYQQLVRGETETQSLDSTLSDLYKEIWQPIEDKLPPDTNLVVLSPEGQLNFVSFATLINGDKKFLAELHGISYVASGRDLLRERRTITNDDVLIFADPDFQSRKPTTGDSTAHESSVTPHERGDFRSLSFGRLKGTAEEANGIKKLIGRSAKIYFGPSASELQVRKTKSPRILHLATHGFFLPEIDTQSSLEPVDFQPLRSVFKLVNPMQRSGLAFAGAQQTLDAWLRGEFPRATSDGILTAEEVSELSLDGTWLVVLSACDTGLGNARVGEGIMGLRRGFVRAGAQNLLITLWPIKDSTTAQMMLDFYKLALRTRNPAFALVEVQRRWLVNLRGKRGISDAVRLAGAFILSSQGKD